jgi:hypothetical protein
VSGVLDTAGAGRGVDVGGASGSIITALLGWNPALHAHDPRSCRGHAPGDGEACRVRARGAL